MHVAVAAMDVECSFATLFGEGFGRRPERGQAGKRLQREPPDIEAIAGFGEKLDDRAVIPGRGAVGEAAEGDGAAGVEVEPVVAEAGAQPPRPRPAPAVACRLAAISCPGRPLVGACPYPLTCHPGPSQPH